MRGRRKGHWYVGQPEGGLYHAPHAGQMRLVQGSKPKDGQNNARNEDRCPAAAQGHYNMPHSQDVRMPGLRQNDRGQVRHGTRNITGAQPAGLGGRLLGEEGHIRGVSDSLENKYEVKFSKTTIQRVLGAVASGLEPEYEGQSEGCRLYRI